MRGLPEAELRLFDLLHHLRDEILVIGLYTLLQRCHRVPSATVLTTWPGRRAGGRKALPYKPRGGGAGRGGASGPGAAPRPFGERRRRNARFLGRAGDVGVVADAVEPLEHQSVVRADLSDLFDRGLHEFHRLAGRPADDPGGVRHRAGVAGDVDRAAVQILVIVHGPSPVLSDVL